MKMSQVIKILKAAQKQYGDLPIAIMTSHTGCYDNVKEIYKMHPISSNGCSIDRNKPPCQIIFSPSRGCSADLILGNGQK